MLRSIQSYPSHRNLSMVTSSGLESKTKDILATLERVATDVIGNPDILPCWNILAQSYFIQSSATPILSGLSAQDKPSIVLTCKRDLLAAEFCHLRQKAIDMGAMDLGGFIIDLEDMNERNQISTQMLDRFHETHLSPMPKNLFKLDVPFVKGFKYDIAKIKPWPKIKILPDYKAKCVDLLEARLYSECEAHGQFRGARYSFNIDVDTEEQRSYLGLSPQSLLQNLAGNALDLTREKYPGIHTPEAFISGPGFGSCFGIHKEDYHLEALNLLVVGASKLWILIPKAHASAFESLVEDLSGVKRKCDHFVREHYMMPSRKALEDADIGYHLMWQQQGQLVVLFELVYHAGWNLGPGIAEAINHAPQDWVPPTGYVACSKACKAVGDCWITRDGLLRADGPKHSLEVSSGLDVPPTEDSNNNANAALKVNPDSVLKQNISDTSLSNSLAEQAKPRTKNPPKRKSARIGEHIPQKRVVFSNSILKVSSEMCEGFASMKEYAQAEKSKWESSQQGTNLSFLNVDLMIDFIKDHQKVQNYEIDVILRIFYGIASVEALLQLRDMFSSYREAPPDQVTQISTLRDRYKFIITIEHKEASLTILKRYQLMKFAEECEALHNTGRVNDSSFIPASGRLLRSTNPRYASHAQDTDQLIRHLYSDPKEVTERIRKRLTGMRKMSARLLVLTKRFGLGILVLIPVKKEPRFRITDER